MKNDLQCEICNSISHLELTPKNGDVYECPNCATIFVMAKIEDYHDFYKFMTLKFHSRYDYNQFIDKVRTREQFTNLFIKNDLGIFSYRFRCKEALLK